MMQITIWDTDQNRVMKQEKNLNLALAAFAEKALILVESEPPRIGRHNLFGKTPAIEINGDFWTPKKANELVTQKDFVELLTAIFGREPKYALK